jgi:hypothetical protein
MSLKLSTLDLKKSTANINRVPFVLQVKQKYFPVSEFQLALGRFSVHLSTEDLGQSPVLFIKAISWLLLIKRVSVPVPLAMTFRKK